ncbi:hypothetical protein CUMW_242830, partial [Citrus unshiu]
MLALAISFSLLVFFLLVKIPQLFLPFRDCQEEIRCIRCGPKKKKLLIVVQNKEDNILEIEKQALTVGEDDKCRVFIIQSSKKAEKRAKKQQQALFVAATREENVRLTINSHENVETSTPSTNNGKRKRGPTTLAMIRDHIPYLLNSMKEYATFAGVAAREHVPIVIKDWRLVPSKTKEDLWSLIKKKKSSDPTKITRVDVWLEGHRKKNGEPANEAVGRRMEKVVEYQEIDNNPKENIDIRNDVVAKAYGSKKRGRVRARGFGVTPTAENLHNRSTQKVRELESQLHTQSQRVEILEQKFEQMTVFMLKQLLLILQNLGRPDDVMSAHECTPRSQQGSGTMHENLELENASCQLLHWYSDDPVEVVAEGK